MQWGPSIISGSANQGPIKIYCTQITRNPSDMPPGIPQESPRNLPTKNKSCWKILCIRVTFSCSTNNFVFLGIFSFSLTWNEKKNVLKLIYISIHFSSSKSFLWSMRQLDTYVLLNFRDFETWQSEAFWVVTQKTVLRNTSLTIYAINRDPNKSLSAKTWHSTPSLDNFWNRYL